MAMKVMNGNDCFVTKMYHTLVQMSSPNPLYKAVAVKGFVGFIGKQTTLAKINQGIILQQWQLYKPKQQTHGTVARMPMASVCILSL
jgi:hypothetical protein